MKRYFAVFIALYTTVLLYMMFYASGREPSGISYIQWQPFITIDRFFNGQNVKNNDFLVNIVGNILLFSPFGWLGLVVQKFNNLKKITISFLLSIIVIESLQYITGRGVADIDDIFLNTIGMLLGFVIFKYITFKNFANICHHFQISTQTKTITTSKTF